MLRRCLLGLVAAVFCGTARGQAVQPVLWLDASQPSRLAIEDGKISSWTGRGPGKVKLQQAEAPRRPQWGEPLAGHRTVAFAGEQFLEGPAVLAEGDDTLTIIALWRPRRIAVQSVFEQAGRGGGRRVALLQVQGAYGFNGQSNDFHSAIRLTANQWRLSTIVLNGNKQDNVLVFDNDTPPAIGTIDRQLQNVGVDRVTIGKKVYGGEFLQGDLAELRVFDAALTSAELREQLASFRATWKLKFEVNVPDLAQLAARDDPQEPAAGVNLKPSSEQLAFFETRVRPVLVEHCYECHSGDSKVVQAGLRLDGPEWIAKGGESGALVAPGKPDESLLVQSVRYQAYEMPPRGKLSAAQIAALETWVKMGVPWPGGATRPAATTAPPETAYDWDRYRREHWAFRPIVKPKLPAVQSEHAVATDLDRFVVARLEAAGIQPNPLADKRILVRRLYLDLIGLPPTAEQLASFLADDRPDAMAQLVDQLLETKQHGERMARHWLDVARYSDGLGGFLDSDPLPNAWHYRDWVVAAFNADMPYDQFVRSQIAGDSSTSGLDPVGTGFFAVGPTYRSDGGDPEAVAQARAETLADRVDTFSRGFLGLTVACARCHDHKFDPISLSDYYALAGVFNNTKVGDHPLATAEVVQAWNESQEALKKQNAAIKQFLDQHAKRLGEKDHKKVEQQLEGADKLRLTSLREQLAALQQAAPSKYPTAHVLSDSGSADMHVALRGDLRKQGPLAERRFLRILAGRDADRFTSGSGRRELADAVVDPRNPLTARVIVNRVWQWHFGRALVRTPSNFGTLGERPTHPELLDWLAADFMADGWSLKSLHRKIVLSATWQRGSRFVDHKFQQDGDNRLLWRMNPRRLEVEAWRDSLLAVTGELDRTLGGPPSSDILSSARRTLYTTISRNGDRLASDEFLRLFDFPAPRVSSAGRAVSTVPQQYLFMLNSPFMLRRAKALAADLQQLPDDEARIRAAYLRLYARPVTADELRLGLAFLASNANDPAAGERPNAAPDKLWARYAQVLLSAHEFLQVQ